MPIDLSGNKKIIAYGLGLSIPIAIVAAYLWFTNDDAQNERDLVNVRVVEVTTSKVAMSSEALGTTQAVNSIQLTSSVSELIRDFHKDEGALVKKGDLLVSLEKEEQLGEKDEIIYEIEEHKRELSRLESLYKQNAASKSKLEARRTQLLKSRAQLRTIEARIADRDLRAPFDGVLGIRNLSIGSLIRPGEAIMSLDAIDPIRIDMTVPASYLNFLSVGQDFVALSPIFPDIEFKGQISHIDSRIDPQTRSLKVRGELPNSEQKLKPGLLMNVSITSKTIDTIMVPEIGVFSRGKNNFVYVVDSQDQVELRKVELGYRQPGKVEITKGLNIGENVIVEGIVRVRPGVKVNVQKDAASADVKKAS